MKKRLAGIIAILGILAVLAAIALFRFKAETALPSSSESVTTEPSSDADEEKNAAVESTQKENLPAVAEIPDEEETVEGKEAPASEGPETSGEDLAVGTPDAEGNESGSGSDNDGSEGTGTPTGESGHTEAPSAVWTEWDSFLAMSPAAQDEFMMSFESIDAFTAWMVAAQQEWAAAHPTEEIGPDGAITIG